MPVILRRAWAAGGRKMMLIDPSGAAMPCHAADVIPGLTFDNVRDRTVGWIWDESSAFRRFRGEDWMSEPCRSCDRREQKTTAVVGAKRFYWPATPRLPIPSAPWRPLIT